MVEYTAEERAAYARKKAAERKRNARRAPGKRAYAPRTRQVAVKKPGVISDMGGELGSVAGGMLLPGVGGPVGRFLGGKLGHLVEKITGFGDYKVEQNSIMKGGLSHPQIVNSVEGGGVIIRFREYITDIQSTVLFTNRSFIIQPGSSDTFPWLSTIASSFEQYKLRGMLFEFNSTSSDAIFSGASSSALGSVIMSTDYDIADEPPTSKRQMLNSLYACSEKPSKSFIHPIECKKSLSAQNLLYTRRGQVPTGYDPRLYDFARFNLATEGMQAAGAGVIGELWLTYEVEFLKQQTQYPGLMDHLYFNIVTTVRPLGTVDSATGNLKRGATLGGTIASDGRTYYFPATTSSGKYLVCYSVTGANTAGVIPASISSTTNCAMLNFFANGAINFVAAPNPAAGSNCPMRNVVINVTAANANFQFDTSNGVYPSSPAGDLWVVRLPDNLVAQ